MTARAHKTLSTPPDAVKSIAKGTSDNPSTKKEVKASWSCNSLQATASTSSLVMGEQYQSFSLKSNSWVLANRVLIVAQKAT